MRESDRGRERERRVIEGEYERDGEREGEKRREEESDRGRV